MSCTARATRVLLAAAPIFALLTGPGCNRPASVHEVADPPSIVEPMPAAPGTADGGKPGQWEPVKDGGAPGRLFFVEAAGASPVRGVVLVHSWWGVNAEMRELARELAARGATRLELTSNVKRADAHAFYEKRGWTRQGYRFEKK